MADEGNQASMSKMNGEENEVSLLSVLNRARERITDADKEVRERVYEPASLTEPSSKWKEWAPLEKSNLPGGEWPTRPKRKIPTFGNLKFDTPADLCRCKKLEVWYPQELEEEVLAKSEELIRTLFAQKWIFLKRLVIVLMQWAYRVQGKRNWRLIGWMKRELEREEQERVKVEKKVVEA